LSNKLTIINPRLQQRRCVCSRDRVVNWYWIHHSENALVRGGVGTQFSNFYTAVDMPEPRDIPLMSK
jgi:hypothetical protein